MNVLHRQQFIALLLCLIISALVFAGSARAGHDGAAYHEFSADARQQGREAHLAFAWTYGFYEEPKVLNYLRSVGARVTERLPYRIRFYILDTDDVNAYAAPGGCIYVTRGMLVHLNSEAELAAVLGHELAHVMGDIGGLDEVSRNTLRAMLDDGAELNLSNTGDTQAQPDMLHTRMRRYELEADRISFELLVLRGYNARALIDVIRMFDDYDRMVNDIPKSHAPHHQGLVHLSNIHPDNQRRIMMLQEAVSRFDAQHAEDGRGRYLAMIENIRFGNQPNLKATDSASDFLQRHEVRKLKLLRVEGGARYADLAADSSLGDSAEAVLRTLNRAYPVGEPISGEFIKIIE